MKYPETIKFRVLQRDIDKAVKIKKNYYGSFNICRECPLAQAAKRIFKDLPLTLFISVGCSCIMISNKETHVPEVCYTLNLKLKSYILLAALQWKYAKPSKTYILTKGT